MSTTHAPGAVAMIALSEIRHDRNVRQELHGEEIAALARSIELLGQLTPVSVRPDERGGYMLIAGHKRYAALERLGRDEIRAEVRADDPDAEASERAAENIVRSQLNPHEEAIAVQAMLQRGLTIDGAAQALGWSKSRVSSRVKLLELPELAQKLIGQGVLPVGSVEVLRTIGAVSQEILDVLVNHLAGGGWGAERFCSEPGYVLAEAIRTAEVFGAYLSTLDSREISSLRLGKRTDRQYAELVELEKKLDRHSHGQPRVPFIEEDVDQARAAGVLIELPGSQAVIVDRSVYRELAKNAIKRHVQTLTEKVRLQAQSRNSTKLDSGGAAADPAAEAKREHGRQLRQLAEQAHGVNTDLGWSLRNGLAVVDPSDMNVARFFAFALLEGDAADGYGTYGERAQDLAARGIRLVIEEFRTDVTKTKKDGARGCCGSITASRATLTGRVSGCGSTSKPPRPRASCTAGRWL